MNHNIQLREERGFTLIELVIAIVVVGILSAVAIVGISGLTDSGETASCNITRDAAKVASAVHFANEGTYPSTFGQMTSATPPELELASGVTGAGATLTGKGWTLSITAGGGQTPTAFSDCPT